MSFSLPPIHDNPDGSWGPSTSNIPDQFKFKDIPYAPYSKSDKLGRFADWNEASTDNRQNAAGLPPTQANRGGQNRRREGNQAFGSGTASAFAYFHAEDESTFSLVDNKTTTTRRGTGFSRGRVYPRTAGGYGNRGMAKNARGGNQARGGAFNRNTGQRRNWRDWDKVKMSLIMVEICSQLNFLQGNRARESSVVISPQWNMLEEIEFHRLSKLRLEVDEPENL